MKQWEVWLLRTANLLVSGTGLVYAVMLYLMRPVDEWSVVNHPWQPHVQHLHVLLAPTLVFMVGAVWNSHAITKTASGKTTGRMSGFGLLLTFFPMLASGYLIQTAVEPTWRSAWVAVHLISSGLWILAALVHHVRPHCGHAAVSDSFVNPDAAMSSKGSNRRRAGIKQFPLTTSRSRRSGANEGNDPAHTDTSSAAG